MVDGALCYRTLAGGYITFTSAIETLGMGERTQPTIEVNMGIETLIAYLTKELRLVLQWPHVTVL
jgi:hypothetical protein